ncbi:MAG: hypothetical protein IJM55_04260 [Ruminococcus sp.]|nr:hypothetical protein [Ruminococcus sp.]
MKIATGMEFVNDEAVIGKWENIGWTENTGGTELAGLNKNSGEFNDLYFLPDGSLVQSYMDKKWYDKWTKELIINLHRTTAAAYIIKEVNGTEYLFIEWKMGNYIYGGMRPEYYVFKREMSQ